MNMKETRQAMRNNDRYISLYDYSGRASKKTGLGKKVYNAAKEKGVRIIYKDLPADLSSPEYNRVATYPTSFLDEYFGNAISSNNISIEDVYSKLVELKEQFDQLVAKLEQNQNSIKPANSHNDNLPF